MSVFYIEQIAKERVTSQALNEIFLAFFKVEIKVSLKKVIQTPFFVWREGFFKSIY
jgi:hypothetical protein